METNTNESDSSIEITATRIIGYAIYPESMAIYPITVEDWHQDADGRIDFGYDSLNDDPPTVIPEPNLCWQVHATRNNVVICVGVSDQPVNEGDWLDRGRKACDDEAVRWREVRERARAKIERKGL